VTLLGTGAPPPRMDRFGPSTLVEVGGKKFIFDAGRGAMQRLAQLRIRWQDVDGVFLTHLHSDHISGLPDVFTSTWIFGRKTPLELYGPKGVKGVADGVLKMFAVDIPIRRDLTENNPAAGAKFDIHTISEGVVYQDEDVKITAFLVDHVFVKPAFGYLFEGGGRRIVISGDTRPSENLMRACRGIDCLVHECCEMSKTSWYPECGWPTIEEKIRDLASYHTQPDDIGRVAEGARPGRLVINHLMPGSDPAELKAAAEKYYRGPVTVADDLLEV